MAPCRKVTHKTPKGRSIAPKREDRVLRVLEQQQSKLIRKQRSGHRRTCRRIWNQGCKETEKPAKMSKEQLRRIAKVMRDLNLPYSVSESHGENSLEGLPRFLRWSVDEYVPSRKHLGHFSERTEPLRTRSSFKVPAWNQAPICASHLGIHKSLSRFGRSCWLKHAVHIPSHWPVFEGVVWSELTYFRALGMTNSSDIGQEDAHASQVQEPWFVDDSDFAVSVRCHAQRIVPARLRSFWTLFSAMNPARFRWRPQTEERAARRHARRHVGFLDLNQASINHDIWPQHSMETFLGLWGSKAEMSCPSEVGRLVTNAVATSMFPAQSRQAVRWPAVFNQAGKPPVVDYTCRVTQSVMEWRDDLCPLLFAAQYGTGDQKHAIEQLAKAFQPMMTMFILYYLDCRTSRNQNLPSWMLLFGVVYDESGLTIRAHYPCFDPPQQGTKSSRAADWGSASRSMGNDYCVDVCARPNHRAGVVAALNRIQGHCVHVMQMLKAWGGYEAAVSRLLI